jgi:pimeloyl-ACP methyl ester carboxylesterase
MKNLSIIITVIVFLFSFGENKEGKKVNIASNNIPIDYKSCGKADTTLLFVHGWCIDKEYWEKQMDFFCPRYKVVAIDLPGFGKSGKIDSSWSFENYTGDVKSVIEQLKLKNVILVGHSMCGDLLLDMSNQFPNLITGIVGIDNLHNPSSPFTAEQKKSADDFFDLLYNRFDSVVNNIMAKQLFQPSTDTTVSNRVLKSIAGTGRDVAVQVLQSNAVFVQQQTKRMQNLHHKLYLVNSDVFPIASDSLNKYCSKGFHVAYVHGTGHYPMLEKPDEFNAVLQQVIFLAGKGG